MCTLGRLRHQCLHFLRHGIGQHMYNHPYETAQPSGSCRKDGPCGSRVEGSGPRVKNKKMVSLPTQDGVVRCRAWVDHVKDIAAPLDSLMCLAADKKARRSLR